MAISLEMRNYLALSVTTLCQALKVVAADGTTVRVVSHTRPLTINGEEYLPVPFTPFEIEKSAGLAADQTEIEGILANGLFTEQDFLSERWDAARVEIQVVNYLDLSMGYAQRVTGYFGELTIVNGTFKAEIHSQAEPLNYDGVEATSPHCRVKILGDAECGVNLASFTHTGTISAVTSRRIFTVSVSQPDGYFDAGICEFTSGNNLGAKLEIRRHVGSQIELMLPVTRPINSGDGVKLIAGCDRTRATCRDKFDNVERGRFFPDMPNARKVLKIPD